MRISDWSSDVCSSDLRGWTQARPLQSDAVRYEGTPVRYELTLEATRMPWLMALDLPQPVGLPPDVTLNHDGELLSRKPVNERIRYTLISNPQYVLEPQLDARARTRLTRSEERRVGKGCGSTCRSRWS